MTMEWALIFKAFLLLWAIWSFSFYSLESVIIYNMDYTAVEIRARTQPRISPARRPRQKK